MLEAEKKTSDARKCSREKFMMNEGVEKIILATLNSPKNSPPTPSEMKKLACWYCDSTFACIFLFCFVFFFPFPDNLYCGPVSKKENCFLFEAPSHVDIFCLWKISRYFVLHSSIQLSWASKQYICGAVHRPWGG